MKSTRVLLLCMLCIFLPDRALAADPLAQVLD